MLNISRWGSERSLLIEMPVVRQTGVLVKKEKQSNEVTFLVESGVESGFTNAKVISCSPALERHLSCRCLSVIIVVISF